jgi:hypothetical protein
MATTTRREDFLGRDLLNEGTTATDFLGRATSSTTDFLGRALTSSAWVAVTAYTLGTEVELVGGADMVVTVAGTSGASTPTPPAIGATVVDGTVTWRRLD